MWCKESCCFETEINYKPVFLCSKFTSLKYVWVTLNSVVIFHGCEFCYCRIFVGINPQRGSRTETKNNKVAPAVHPRVLKLSGALRDHTSQWKI